MKFKYIEEFSYGVIKCKNVQKESMLLQSPVWDT